MGIKIQRVNAIAPALRKMPRGGVWEYAEDWRAEIVLKEEGRLVFAIRRGYWTDLASVPKALRGAFDNGSGSYGVLLASQIHDCLYSSHYTSKDFADDIFLKLLRFYGVGVMKSYLYYSAVSLFGRSAWEGADEGDRKFIAFSWLA